jgi:hypothetical protein
MSILPKEVIKASTDSPKRLVFYSAVKSGKTTALSMLDDCLILDFEDGSDYVDAKKIKVIGIVTPKEENPEVKTKRESENKYYLQEVVGALKAENLPYKRLAVDTSTGMEEQLAPIALALYQATPMGKSFTGNVLTLPNGAGYLYLRMAFDKVITMIESVCKETLISGHLKERIVETGGKEVTSKDIDLTGKLKNIACSKADAVAYLYRKGNQVIMNFKTSEEVTCGARPEHLKNKEIVITEMIDGKIVSHWDRIYLS